MVLHHSSFGVCLWKDFDTYYVTYQGKIELETPIYHLALSEYNRLATAAYAYQTEG